MQFFRTPCVHLRSWTELCLISLLLWKCLEELRLKDMSFLTFFFFWVLYLFLIFFPNLLLVETFVWKRAATSGDPPSARDSHTCSSWKNKIIVIGGEDGDDYYLSDVHILDAGFIFLLSFFNEFHTFMFFYVCMHAFGCFSLHGISDLLYNLYERNCS